MQVLHFLGLLFAMVALGAILADRARGGGAAAMATFSGMGLFVVFPIAWYFFGDLVTGQIVTGIIGLLFVGSCALPVRQRAR